MRKTRENDMSSVITEVKPREVPIEWRVPDDILTLRATNITLGIMDTGEVIIQFFETRPPLLIGTQGETQSRAEQIVSVPAICVARLVVTPGKLKEFAGVFENLAARISGG